jgi:two-component system, cell cycle sensor histidine kinase and response regulator CckA
MTQELNSTASAIQDHQSLAPNEDMYRKLVENLPDAILIQCDHKIVYANPACLRLLAASSPEQVLGKDISEIISPDHLPIIEQVIRDSYGKQTASPLHEHSVIALNGSLVDVEAVAMSCTWNGSPGLEVVIRDIRERKRAERAARDWHNRLELAQRAGLQIGLWDWNLTADTVIWSDESYRQWGFTRDSFAGDVKDTLVRIHADDLPIVVAAVQKVHDGETRFAAQYRVIRPDQSICWIDAHGVIVPSESTHMLGIGIDITGLKLAELAVAEREAKYLRLLNSTAEGIFELDLAGVCTFANPAAAHLYGYTEASQLVGILVHEKHHYMHSDGTPYLQADCKIHKGFLHGRGTHVDDETFVRVDGSPFPVEYWSYPIRRDDEIVGAVVTFTNITDRVQGDRLLRDSVSNYRSIVDEAPYGIYRTDVEGHILLANPALATMLGHSIKELYALNVARDIYRNPEQRDEITGHALATGRVKDHEVEWKRKDGTSLMVRMSGVPVQRADGHVTEFQVIVEDITERRTLERQFWQAQKLEAVGRLAGGVAHDFNNVLMIVSSYAELILQLELDNPKLLDYARKIRDAGAKAASVTQQLLAFSRKQMLEPEVLDPNLVARDLSKILPKLLGEDIEFVAKLDSSVSRVRVDRGQMEQILMNLAVNARDAMPKGGSLVIETQNVTLDPEFAAAHPPTVAGDYVMLSVTDNGMGMDSETRAKVFEPFFTTKERGKGTGLGLATVYGIVKQSGGFIWLKSEVGKGSSFEIYLPQVAELPAAGIPPAAIDASAGGTETILVVEDEGVLRTAVCEYLRSRGYGVLHAANGADALLVSAKHRGAIQAVLTDLVMPGLDGVELGAALLSMRPNLKILYMSGYHDRAVAGLAPGSTLLRKPCSLQTMALKLREVLDAPLSMAEPPVQAS